MTKIFSSTEANVMCKGNFVFSLDLEMDFVEEIRLKSNLSRKEKSCERRESLCVRWRIESYGCACVTTRG